MGEACCRRFICHRFILHLSKKMNNLLRSLALFVFLSLTGYGALATEANHKIMKGMAEYFHDVAALPEKYISFVREVEKLPADASRYSENWEVKLEPNPDEDRTLYLQGVANGKAAYAEIQADFLELNGKLTPARIDYRYFEVKDAKGGSLEIKVPFINIPKNQHGHRVKVHFIIDTNRQFGQEEFGLSLELSKKIPVESAALILRSDASGGGTSNIENHGFKELERQTDHGRLTQKFVLDKKWTGAEDAANPEIPRLFVSFKSWSDIAALHGQFYQEQMAIDLTSDFEKLNISPQVFNKQASESDRETAYRIYKWFATYFNYRLADFSLDPKSKYQPKPLQDILKSKEGMCTDYALTYIKLLSLAGIYAEPVEVNVTENWGAYQIKHRVPRFQPFVHVIVYIPVLDLYVDPTSSKSDHKAFSQFAIQSADFSNSMGLFLFSKKFQEISPGKVQKEAVIHTDISLSQGKWVGTTYWLGKGNAYQSLMLMNEMRDKRIKEGKGFDIPFRKNNDEYIPDSWKLEYDDLMAEAKISFSFELKSPPVDLNGKLIYLPENIMTSVLLKYDSFNASDMNNDFCFSSAKSEEIITVHGVKNIGNSMMLQERDIDGIGSRFTQNFSIDREDLKLTRQFQLNEKRAYCPDADIERQKNFYKEIKAVTAVKNK